MKLVRYVEIAAWVAGLTLLGVYGGARWRYASSYADALATFHAARGSSSSVQAVAAPPSALIAGDPVDVSTWSASRIERYRHASRERSPPDAVLRIPALELVVPVFEGTSERNLNRGAGRIEGTSRIGAPGNVGIAAHRDGFFRVLKDVRIGDALFLDRMTTTEEYRVVATSIVAPSNVSVLDATPMRAVTLVTCYPFYYVGAAPRRFIVRAQLVSPGEDDDRERSFPRGAGEGQDGGAFESVVAVQ